MARIPESGAELEVFSATSRVGKSETLGGMHKVSRSRAKADSIRSSIPNARDLSAGSGEIGQWVRAEVRVELGPSSLGSKVRAPSSELSSPFSLSSAYPARRPSTVPGSSAHIWWCWRSRHGGGYVGWRHGAA